MSDDVPSIALSLSGGDLRAALFNVAALEAFDARNKTSVTKGLGGLLQSSTYIAGLSGGSYVVASLMFNEFASGHDLVFGNNATGVTGWQLEQSLLGPMQSSTDEKAFVGNLITDLAAKRIGANFTVTFCDFWGRGLAYHFLPGTPPNSFTSNATAGNHAAALTFSSATNLTSWKNHALPFPLVVINVNSPNVHGTTFESLADIPLTSVVYELSPLEFGSYEPQLSSFVSLPYLGSTFSRGKPSSCVRGFDNAGLMIGTSSCDFNQLNVSGSPEWTSQAALGGFVSIINSTFDALQPNQEMDVTSVPNPFHGLKVGTYQDANETALALFDGSLDDENDPVFPLLIKKREVDVIVVLDSSGETADNKPDGLSLLATKAKTELLPRGFMNFPRPFPNSTDEFVSLGFSTRPTFFGCDGTTNPEDQYPLFVFIPNADPAGVTNITTSTLQLPLANQTEIFDRSYRLASRGFANDTDINLTQSDEHFGTCVACAAVERMRARRGIPRTQICDACFSRYCFTGTGRSSSNAAVGADRSSSASWAVTGTHAAAIAGNLAAESQSESGDSTREFSTLERNSYISIGLLGAILLLLAGIMVMLVRMQRQSSKGYAPIGVGSESEARKMVERDVLVGPYERGGVAEYHD